MHEMSITQGIVDVCLRHATGKPVTAVVVEIGRLSGVVPEAVDFCFAACTRDTLLDDARLEIRQIDGTAYCLDCGCRQPIERLYDPCRQCGGFALELTGGQEMRVIEIEVAD